MTVVLAVLTAAAVLTWPSRAREWTPSGARIPWVGRSLGPVRRGTGRLPGVRRPVGTARVPGAQVSLLPEVLELYALALQGGGSLAGAARSVGASVPGELGEELLRVGLAMERGEDPESVWAAVGPHWWPARRSLDLAALAGVPPGEALVGAAQDLRREGVSAVEVAAARLGVRLVLPLALAFLPAFVLTTVLPLVLALVQEMGGLQ
jgi:tight adherence protein B